VSLDILALGNRIGKGLLSQFAPDMLQGALVDLFKEKNLDIQKTTAWVEGNKSLWDSLGEERQEQFKRLAPKIGSLDRLDADWAINALRGDFPAVASLFLGWKKAHNWLGRQIVTIKVNLKSNP